MTSWIRIARRGRISLYKHEGDDQRVVGREKKKREREGILKERRREIR